MNPQGVDAFEAAAALDGIDVARRRGAELRGYAHAGKHLVAWGLVWLAGNLAVQFAPERATWVWAAGIACAVVFQLLSAGTRTSWRVLATVATALGFCAASIALTGIGEGIQPAFVSLVVAAVYVGLGIWTGARFAWLGLLLAGIILIARFALPQWLPVMLGIGGGGALIISGLWLRRA